MLLWSFLVPVSFHQYLFVVFSNVSVSYVSNILVKPNFMTNYKHFWVPTILMFLFFLDINFFINLFGFIFSSIHLAYLRSFAYHGKAQTFHFKIIPYVSFRSVNFVSKVRRKITIFFSFSSSWKHFCFIFNFFFDLFRSVNFFFTNFIAKQ